MLRTGVGALRQSQVPRCAPAQIELALSLAADALVRCQGRLTVIRLRAQMLGTLFNSGAIVLGALVGLMTKTELSARLQQQIKILLGVATSFFGLKLVWMGLKSDTNGSFFPKFGIVLLAMVFGHLIGRLIGIQTWMNRLGQQAKSKLELAALNGKKAAGDGLMAAALLFCAAPLGLIGALEDGLQRYFQPLAIKAVMDCLAAFSFARLFGWTAALAAFPVAALLSGLTLLGDRLEPWLDAHGVLGVVHASCGLIMTYIALVIFEIKKVEIGNYLPALLLAPVLMKLARVLFA